MFSPLVEKCKSLNRAMRIGTNHGSLSARILSFYGAAGEGGEGRGKGDGLGRACSIGFKPNAECGRRLSGMAWCSASQSRWLAQSRLDALGPRQLPHTFSPDQPCPSNPVTGDTPRGMVESAFEFADICRDMDYHNFVFSMKVRSVRLFSFPTTKKAGPPVCWWPLSSACGDASSSVPAPRGCLRAHPWREQLPGARVQQFTCCLRIPPCMPRYHAHRPPLNHSSPCPLAQASNPLVMVQAYRLLAEEQYNRGWDYPLHLGVTEAGA